MKHVSVSHNALRWKPWRIHIWSQTHCEEAGSSCTKNVRLMCQIYFTLQLPMTSACRHYIFSPPAKKSNANSAAPASSPAATQMQQQRRRGHLPGTRNKGGDGQTRHKTAEPGQKRKQPTTRHKRAQPKDKTRQDKTHGAPNRTRPTPHQTKPSSRAVKSSTWT